MEIDNALIEKLASLSKLHFNDVEKQTLKVDLQNMLNFVNKLNKLETSGVQPLMHISNNTKSFRPDIENCNFDRADALKNATIKDDDFFKVPKVIQK